MTDTKRLLVTLDEVAEGPDAIRSTVALARPAARIVAEELRDRGVERVFLIGNGTSFHSACAAATLYDRHAGPNDPPVRPLTAGSFVTYPPHLTRRDAVIGISASGEFHDVIRAFREFSGPATTVGIVHVPGSSLDQIAEFTVRSAGGPSQVPVMTKTFSATLVAAQLLLLELLGGATADPVVRQIDAAANDAAATMDSARSRVPSIVAALDDCDDIFVVGAGGAYPASLEAALKLKEISLRHAEASESWEFTSGAATIIGPSTAVIGLLPPGPGESTTREVLRQSSGWGARVIELAAEQRIPTSMWLPLCGDSGEDLASLTTVPPIVLLALGLARARGLDPDRPGWIARYQSQGLTHVLHLPDARPAE